MATKKQYRINGFEQQRVFYSLVFSGKYDLKTHHVSLYGFLLNQNNRNNWVEWFSCPFDLAMQGACIQNRRTYYRALHYLAECGLIKYIPGINAYRAPKISIVPLLYKNVQQEIPQCEPLDAPLPEQLIDNQGTQQGPPQRTQLIIPLPELVPEHIYKHITDNINNYITSNWTSLKSGPEITHIFFIGKEKIFDLKKYLEERFEKQIIQLKKNCEKISANFYSDNMKKFSDSNIEKKWKDEEDLRSHFVAFIKKQSENKKPGIVKTKNNELDREQLKTKYKV